MDTKRLRERREKERLYSANYYETHKEKVLKRQVVYQCPRCATSMEVDPTAKASRLTDWEKVLPKKKNCTSGMDFKKQISTKSPFQMEYFIDCNKVGEELFESQLKLDWTRMQNSIIYNQAIDDCLSALKSITERNDNAKV